MDNLFGGKMNLDLIARQVLMSAYLYYKRDHSVLTDHENDANVKLLVENWECVPERYKPLLDPDGNFSERKNTGAGITLTTFDCRYTRLVEGGAIAWLKAQTGEVIEPLYQGYYEF